jgi:hypothetical protein
MVIFDVKSGKLIEIPEAVVGKQVRVELIYFFINRIKKTAPQLQGCFISISLS